MAIPERVWRIIYLDFGYTLRSLIDTPVMGRIWCTDYRGPILFGANNLVYAYANLVDCKERVVAKGQPPAFLWVFDTIELLPAPLRQRRGRDQWVRESGAIEPCMASAYTQNLVDRQLAPPEPEPEPQPEPAPEIVSTRITAAEAIAVYAASPPVQMSLF